MPETEIAPQNYHIANNACRETQRFGQQQRCRLVFLLDNLAGTTDVIRAAERDDLLPTLRRLRNAIRMPMKWFQRGAVASPEEAESVSKTR
jgi:hypothetical protein